VPPTDARQEAQHEQPGQFWREGRCDAGERVDDDGNHQHGAAANAVGQAAEDDRAHQHPDEEERAGLQRLGHRDAERLGDGRRAEADRQHLHGIGEPDQAEDDEEAILKLADTGQPDAGLERHLCAVTGGGPGMAVRHGLPANDCDRWSGWRHGV
jgi:hypothetical protein